jgi:DNA-directed RNA polymerase subunit alpha
MLEQQSIDVLNLSYEACGALRRSQIHTIADLLLYTEEDLQILAPRSAEEIITALQQTLCLTLPIEPSEPSNA